MGLENSLEGQAQSKTEYRPTVSQQDELFVAHFEHPVLVEGKGV